MIGLELARFLAVCLGFISGWAIFQFLRSDKNRTSKGLRLIVPILFLSFLGSVLIQSYREPIVKRISYRLSQDEFNALSQAPDEVKKMRIRVEMPHNGPILLRPVYKEHLLGTVCLLAFLLIGNKNGLSKKYGPKEKQTLKSLPNLDKNAVLVNLNDILKIDKLYTNPQLNLDTLAAALNISKYHLSQLINQELGKNFYELINDYRVEAAKKLMKDPNYNHLTLSSLGLEVGFNSKASFYRAFKRKTGSTPAAYKKELER